MISSGSVERRSRRKVYVIAASIVGSALIVALLYIWFSPRPTWSETAIYFSYSLVYSIMIGGLMNAVLPLVAPLYWRWSPLPRYAALFATMLLLTAVGCLLAGLVFLAMGWETVSAFWPVFYAGMKIAVVIALSIGIFITILETLRYRLEDAQVKLKTKELERQRALNAATAARLASLESRVHPHFLFNTLNSISSLIPEDPKRAERLVEKMSALMRFSLDNSQTGLAPLASEITIVRDYLEIEEARFGDRLRHKLDVPAEMDGFFVPPFSIQTLVENSVKYAVARRIEGAEVTVTVRNGEDTAAIEVCDTGPGFRPDAIAAGHGLDNLDARLKALFGHEHKLRISSSSGRTVVSFDVPRRREAQS